MKNNVYQSALVLFTLYFSLNSSWSFLQTRCLIWCRCCVVHTHAADTQQPNTQRSLVLFGGCTLIISLNLFICLLLYNAQLFAECAIAPHKSCIFYLDFNSLVVQVKSKRTKNKDTRTKPNKRTINNLHFDSKGNDQMCGAITTANKMKMNERKKDAEQRILN